MSAIIFPDKEQDAAYNVDPKVCNSDDINQLKNAIVHQLTEEFVADGTTQIITLMHPYDTPIKDNVKICRNGARIKSSNLTATTATTITVDGAVPLQADDEIIVDYKYTPIP